MIETPEHVPFRWRRGRSAYYSRRRTNERPPFAFAEWIIGLSRAPGAFFGVFKHPTYLSWRNFFLRYAIQNYRRIFSAYGRVPFTEVK
jgi:hypothetical protein